MFKKDKLMENAYSIFIIKNNLVILKEKLDAIIFPKNKWCFDKVFP